MTKDYRRINKKVLLTVILVTSFHFPALCQSDSEDEPRFILQEVVVVGDRSESLLKKSTTASGVLTVSELSMLPIRNLVDALHYLPGITFVDQDASGHLPMAIVRGFFGGGEAEYMILIVDGVPINDLSSGLINWNLVPSSKIHRIEITRGGGSAMYGDLALGAVINVETRATGIGNQLDIGMYGGQYGTKGIEIFQNYNRSNHSFGLRGIIKKSSGRRDHSEFSNSNFGGIYSYSLPSDGKLQFRVNHDQLDKDEAGPLTQDMIEDNPWQSNAIFKDDNRQKNQFDTILDFLSSDDKANRFSVRAGLRAYNQKQTRTLQLTSQFGDTQFENQDDFIGWTQLQYRRKTGTARWIVGLDAEYGTYHSQYFKEDRTSPLSQGDGNRIKTGVYLESKYEFNSRLRATSGLRFDWINNHGEVNLIQQPDVHNTQLSPRIGIQIQYLSAPLFDGHLYTNWSRAFKAPTLDQLYDTRNIDFFGQTFNFANTSLVPQTSNNVEVGIYQQFSFPSARLFGELSLAGYVLDISNEIDLDLATFKYGNILKSHHNGIEGSLALYVAKRIRFNNTLNLMHVTFESGEFKGNMLKNIPKITFTNRISLKLNSFTNVILTHRYFDKVFLDDANNITIPSYSVFDSKLQFHFQGFEVDLVILNLADELYNSSGYVLFDPFIQEDVKFFYPAQKRYFQIGIRYDF